MENEWVPVNAGTSFSNGGEHEEVHALCDTTFSRDCKCATRSG